MSDCLSRDQVALCDRKTWDTWVLVAWGIFGLSATGGDFIGYWRSGSTKPLVMLFGWVAFHSRAWVLANYLFELACILGSIVAVLMLTSVGWWYTLALTALDCTMLLPAYLIRPLQYDKPFLAEVPMPLFIFCLVFVFPLLIRTIWLVKHRGRVWPKVRVGEAGTTIQPS